MEPSLCLVRGFHPCPSPRTESKGKNCISLLCRFIFLLADWTYWDSTGSSANSPFLPSIDDAARLIHAGAEARPWSSREPKVFFMGANQVTARTANSST